MSTTLPMPIVIMMASHEHRLHHYLWHQVRNSWWEYSDSERNEIRQLGWEPPRPAYTRSTPPRVDVTNNSGEDFLYMHRVMIASVNMRLREIADPAYPKIEGWKQVPAPGDPDYPVPPGWNTGSEELNTFLDTVKSEDFYHQRVKPAESQFSNSDYLKTISLGELGARLEFTIHNWLHMRFCSEVSEIRPDPGQFSSTIDTKWDDPGYNWLGDTYASHVHPLFWKLHGWVDDRIEDWKKAHQISGEINWVGKWVGDMPAPPAPHSLHEMLSLDPEKQMTHERFSRSHDHNHHVRMMKVLKLINKSGICSHFYDTLDPQFNK